MDYPFVKNTDFYFFPWNFSWNCPSSGLKGKVAHLRSIKEPVTGKDLRLPPPSSAGLSCFMLKKPRFWSIWNMSWASAEFIHFSLLVPFPHFKFPYLNIVMFYFEMGFYFTPVFLDNWTTKTSQSPPNEANVLFTLEWFLIQFLFAKKLEKTQFASSQPPNILR